MADKTISVRADKGFVYDSEFYAESKMVELKASDVKKALSDAYLSGAQAAIGIGYRLAEKEYKEVIDYYKKEIKELKSENQF